MRAKFDRKSIKKGLRRVAYLVGNFSSYMLPDSVYSLFMRLRFATIPAEKRRQALKRVDTYVRLAPDARVEDMAEHTVISQHTGYKHYIRTKRAGDYKFPFKEKHKFSSYFFDLYQSMRMMPRDAMMHYLFGDIDHECPEPTFVKTRPVARDGAYTNSVVCRLDRLRHFNFIKDSLPWREKKDKLVSRNHVECQPWRTEFIRATLGSPLCDVGQVNPNPEHPEYVRPFMSMDDQLTHKFIATIEGNDVATNLKWVMSSNSIAVMPAPRVESWFMEGQLIGGYHYIEVKPDYSDLEEKLQYYIDHPDEAEAIIEHAHRFVKQFTSPTVEKFVQYHVAKKYFEITGK